MSPYIIGTSGRLCGQCFVLDTGVVSFGRGEANTVVISSNLVSRSHAEIRREEGGYRLYDRDSRNGTFISGKRIVTQILNAGDKIEIGDETFLFDSTDQDETLVPLPKIVGMHGHMVGQTFLLDASPITFGRGQSCDVVLDNKEVSRVHAEIRLTSHGYVLSDQNSQNGTFVNNQRIQTQVLHNGDVIGIGTELFRFDNPTIDDEPTLIPMPTGTVTFLFTDLQGSTRLWEDAPTAMREAMVRHDRLIEACVMRSNGVVVRPRGEGDSRFAVFAQATDAVSAAINIQHDLDAERWPTPTPLRVRIALHTGEADLREGDYYGTAVNRCARLRGVAQGGQTLISLATATLTHASLPTGVHLRDLGQHTLKDLRHPEHVFEVVAAHSSVAAMLRPTSSYERAVAQPTLLAAAF